MTNDAIAQARAILQEARSCLVLTGAGMSAESGIPTFRDALTGEWSKFDPMALGTREGFKADPPFVWRWYAERRERAKDAQPNAGHLALAGLERRYEPFAIVTQNVDGLHTRAGSTRVLEIHGSLARAKCFAECGVRVDAGELPPGEPPTCPRCGSWLRPDVVWFGEYLDVGLVEEALRLVRRCEVAVVVGTSGVVQPAAGMVEAAKHAGAKVIVVNPHPSELDDLADVGIAETAARTLPQIFAGAVPVRT